MKESIKDKILKLAKLYYFGEDKYYHNFPHVKQVIDTGIKIFDSIGAHCSTINIFILGMAFHDANHLLGMQRSDRENIERALIAFDGNVKSLGFKQRDIDIARSLIVASEFPHKKIEDVLIDCNMEADYFAASIIKVARDADTLGIIGIEDVSIRKKALICFFRELLHKHSKEYLLENYEELTNNFFDDLEFYTDYGRAWAKKYLEKRRAWQLDFAPAAIRMAAL